MLDANKLYDRANKLYKSALLTRCCVQHFLSPYIDTGPKSLLRQGISESEFYGDLMYKLKKIVSCHNFQRSLLK